MHSAVQRILASTAPAQNTPEWLQWRKSRLTASDAAKICGNAPKTWASLLQQKAGLAPSSFQGNAYTEAGHVNEPLAAAAYAQRTGAQLHHDLRPVEHPQHPCLAASLDAVTSCGTNVEIKTFSVAQKPHAKPKPAHIFQTQFQMACTSLLSTHLVYYYPSISTAGGAHMDIHTVKYDDAWFQQKLPKFLQFVDDLNEAVASVPDVIAVALDDDQATAVQPGVDSSYFDTQVVSPEADFPASAPVLAATPADDDAEFLQWLCVYGDAESTS